MTNGVADGVPAEDREKALQRHARGDWGDLDRHDLNENQKALQTGCRIFSAYRASNGVRFWIITEVDRSFTTLLLPEEY